LFSPLAWNVDMGIVIASLGVAFAAFIVWLTVRIVNRRERWAKRIALGIVTTVVLYALSFGPACWLAALPSARDPFLHLAPSRWLQIYWPLGWAANGKASPFRKSLCWYATLWMSRGTEVRMPTTGDGRRFIMIVKG
jgi:hypothetical protein